MYVIVVVRRAADSVNVYAGTDSAAVVVASRRNTSTDDPAALMPDCDVHPDGGVTPPDVVS
jgi:hypothetical protein